MTAENIKEVTIDIRNLYNNLSLSDKIKYKKMFKRFINGDMIYYKNYDIIY